MCRVLQITTSGYYEWKKNPYCRRHEIDERVCTLIRQIFEESHHTYGSPRITYELRALGHQINEKRVARLMKMMDIRASKPRKFVVTTDSNHDQPIAPNLLQQDFQADMPNQKWVSDITYIPTQEGWLYLCIVLDLWSRRVVGWAISDSLATDIVLSATEMATRERKPPAGCIFHSDRGCQYASEEFRQYLKDQGFVQSMSRTACCYDNAVAESFFHSLKIDWIHGRDFKTHDEARQALFYYIAVFYNRFRRHSTLGYLSPENFEKTPAA